MGINGHASDFNRADFPDHVNNYLWIHAQIDVALDRIYVSNVEDNASRKRASPSYTVDFNINEATGAVDAMTAANRLFDLLSNATNTTTPDFGYVTFVTQPVYVPASSTSGPTPTSTSGGPSYVTNPSPTENRGGMIAGIVIGVVVFVAIIIALAVFLFRNRVRSVWKRMRGREDDTELSVPDIQPGVNPLFREDQV